VSKIEVGRYSNLLRRILSMKGVSDVATELSPEIASAFILEIERPEWEFLKGEKLVSAVFATAAVAAQNSGVRLRNPADSGVVAVFPPGGIVLGLTGNTSGIILERNVVQAGLTTALPTVSRDTRYPVLNASALLSSQQNVVPPSGEAYWSTNLPLDEPAQVNMAFVLTPGFQLQLSTLANNCAMRGTFSWLERRLDVMELD